MKNLLINRTIILIILLTIIGISFFYFNILLPFFLGAFIAYLLNPIVNLLERKKINRSIFSLILIIIFFIFIYSFILLVIPIVVEQTMTFLEKFPSIINKIELQISKITDVLNSNFLDSNYFEFFNNINQSLGRFFKVIIGK